MKKTQNAKPTPKSAKPETTISKIIGKTFLETLYAPRLRKTSFGLWAKGQFSTPLSYRLSEAETLIPPKATNSLIRHKVLLLPSFATEYGTQGELVSAIRDFIHRYVDLSEEFEIIAAHYVLLSWVYDRFRAVPYLRIQGDYGTGKSRFLHVIGSLCYKPLFASGASTISPIFHALDSFRGTLVMDEADFRFSDEKADIVKIFNNGNMKGFPLLRSEASKDGTYSPRAFQVFGTKIIATRGSYSDPALESRMISYRAKAGNIRPEIPVSLPDSFEAEAEDLRNRLLMYRFKNWHKLSDQIDTPFGEPGRIAQVFMPLLAVADNDSVRDTIRSYARSAGQALKASYAFQPEEHVLKIIYALAQQSAAPLTIKAIADQYRKKHGSDHTGVVTNKWVGGILRNRLHLSTQKRKGTYIIAPTEKSRLAALYIRYGLNQAD